MSTEETPLLGNSNSQLLPDVEVETRQEQDHNPHEAVYRRFSPEEKRVIVVLVSICGVIPLFVTGTFTPSIPTIAKELDSTGSIISLAVSISAFAASVGGLIGGSYSTFYGRRPIYTFSLPILCCGSIGVATAKNVPSLLFWRFFQSVGASPGLVLGAGVIGDIYRLEERGGAMAIFFASCLVGPSSAPLIGGWMTYHFSWRITQGSLGIVGLLAFLLMYFVFPETSQPGSRGVDKLENGKSGPLFINPLRPMLLLQSPNLLLISVILTCSLISLFALLVPLAYTVGVRYNIPNEAWIGACFLPSGIGTMVGAGLVGRISDRTVISWRQKRNGIWYPEDRLRASLIPFGVTIPVSLLAFGFANKFIDGTLGLVICLIALFLNGVGIEMAFGPCAGYLVDVMHSRSAEALAANGGLRSVLLAAGITAILPMVNTFGVVITNAVFTFFILMSFGILWCIIRYGEQMRGWKDVGFSTAENN